MLRFHIMLLSVFVALTIGALWAVGFICRRPFYWRLALLAFNLLAFFSLPLLWRQEGAREKFFVQAIVFILMSELLFFAAVCLARFLILLGRWLALSAPPFDGTRRELLKGAALYPLAALAAGLYGSLIEKDATVLNEYDIPLAPSDMAEKIPSPRFAAAKISLAQLSDVHIGAFFSLNDLRRLLERTASLGVDALCLTGDIFDDDRLNDEAIRLVAEFCPRFPRGIWYIFGNHEYFRDIAAIEEALAATDIQVLVDESRPLANLDNGQKQRPLYLVGVDYPRFRPRFEELAARSMQTAYQNIPPAAATVLLAHHPDFIDYGAARRAAAVLTGHTHGGQLGLFGFSLAPPLFKYMRGVYRVGETFGYVHTGNGSWFPFRFGCPPEIAVFHLHLA